MTNWNDTPCRRCPECEQSPDELEAAYAEIQRLKAAIERVIHGLFRTWTKKDARDTLNAALKPQTKR